MYITKQKKLADIENKLVFTSDEKGRKGKI